MSIENLYQLYLNNPFVQTDTRKLKEGELFFALSGQNFDGNIFAEQALEKGASYAIIDNPIYAKSQKYIVVNNVLNCLQDLANYHRRQLNIPVIAITGSNGKTTTKELLAAVLRKKYITYSTEGNLNNHIGVPLTLLKIKKDAEIAIIEMGANHKGEIADYCKIALPTHGIITNCGKAHLEGFGNLEGVMKAKGELYDYLRNANGTIFINCNLQYLQNMATGIENKVTYGSENSDYVGRSIKEDVFLKIELSKPVNCIFETNLAGEYNLPNAMVAISVGLHFGVNINYIKNALSEFKPDNSRSQWIEKGSNKIILDAYNANPSSMQEAILNFGSTKLPNKILWLGGMKEMGNEEVAEHIALVSLIEKYEWNNVILVGKEFYGISKNYKWFANVNEAVNYVKTQSITNSSILIKGSRGSKMELMMDAF